MQVLTTPRLRLEPQTLEHADRLFELFQEPDLSRWIAREPPASLQAFRQNVKFLEGRRSHDGTEHWLNWVSVDTASTQIVGRIEVTMLRRSKLAYLAYTTFKGHWRQGYAREGCAAVVAHLFDAWDVPKVLIEMDVQNLASVKLAESLGARRVAFRPGADFFKGAWSDEYAYEIHRPKPKG